MLRTAAAALAVVWVGCAPQFSIDGRPFTVSAPSPIDGQPLPVLILLHGYGTTAEAQNLVFNFGQDVDRRQFLYVLPNGTLDHVGKRFWNATDACCNFDHLTVDDVKFLKDVISEVKANYSVDSQRVFVLGHSNGGFMALRLACEASDVVRGVVSVSGATWSDSARCPSGAPVSVLAVHGTSDPTISPRGGGTELGSFPSADATVASFAARNGCTELATPVGTSDFLGDPDEETDRVAFTGCPAQGRAELWRVAGADHLPRFDSRWRSAVLDWLMNGQR